MASPVKATSNRRGAVRPSSQAMRGILMPDLGGSTGTQEMGAAIAAAV
jgi:hypothetical protein